MRLFNLLIEFSSRKRIQNHLMFCLEKYDFLDFYEVFFQVFEFLFITKSNAFNIKYTLLIKHTRLFHDD